MNESQTNLNPAPARPPPRLLRLLVALASGASGLLQIVATRALGFPDGHLTALEAAMRGPHLALSALSIGLCVALLRAGPRAPWPLLGAAVGALLVDRLGLDLLGALLGLEHGQGG